MEQSALLTILRTETVYRFRLELPEGSSQGDQEYSIDLTPEIRERLRRALQAAAQQMQAIEQAMAQATAQQMQAIEQTMALADVKRQTMKTSANNDSLLNLGRFLFDHLLPTRIQEALRHLDTPLIINTNTPDIP